MINPIYLKATAVVAIVAVVSWQRVEIGREREAHAETRRKNAVVLQELAEKTATSARKALEFKTALDAAVAAVDTAGRARLKEKEDANTKLADDVGAGRKRLLVRAACPAAPAPADVPSAPAAPRVDDGGTAELAPAARSDYFALTGGVDKVMEMLTTLQAYARSGCKGAPP